MENSTHLAPTSATEIDQMSDADIALLWKQVGKTDYTAVHWRCRPMMRSLLLKKLGLPDDKGSGGGTARPGSGGATEVASTPTAPGSGDDHADGVLLISSTLFLCTQPCCVRNPKQAKMVKRILESSYLYCHRPHQNFRTHHQLTARARRRFSASWRGCSQRREQLGQRGWRRVGCCEPVAHRQAVVGA